MAIVKFVSDKDCQVFIDMELVGKVASESMLKVTLEPGGYLIQIKDEEGNLIKKYDLEINPSDNQLLQKIDCANNKKDDIIEKLMNDSSLVFQCDRASFCHNGLYGFVDKTLKVVIPPIYFSVNEFVDNKAFVVRDFPEGKKTTLIDSDGNMFFNRWFDYIGESDETILLGVDNKIIVYSKLTCDKKAEYFNAGYDFKKPIVPVFRIKDVDELYGFIDFEGKEVVPLLFDKVWNFDKRGYAKVLFFGLFGTISEKTYTMDAGFFSAKVNSIEDLVCPNIIELVSTKKIHISSLVYRKLAFDKKDKKWIICINTYDSTGKNVSKIECDKILFMGEGCCVYRNDEITTALYLETDEQYSFQVNYLIPANGCMRSQNCDYDSYYPDTFVTRKNGKYGLIDINGIEIFPNIYDCITPVQPKYFVDIDTKLPVLGIMQYEGKYSVANLSEGITYLPFEYDEIEVINRGIDFKDTIFLLTQKNRHQLFSVNKTHLSEKYDDITVCDKSFIIEKEGCYGIIDDYGKEIVPFDNLIIRKLGDNYLTEGNNYFIIGKDAYALGDIRSGKKLTEQIYDEISILSNGRYFFLVRIGNRYGCLNENGDIVVPAKYDRIESMYSYCFAWDNEFVVSLYDGDNIISFDLVGQRVIS